MRHFNRAKLCNALTERWPCIKINFLWQGTLSHIATVTRNNFGPKWVRGGAAASPVRGDRPWQGWQWSPSRRWQPAPLLWETWGPLPSMKRVMRGTVSRLHRRCPLLPHPGREAGAGRRLTGFLRSLASWQGPWSARRRLRNLQLVPVGGEVIADAPARSYSVCEGPPPVSPQI